MDRDSDRCALELSDAPVDVMGYACLVAIMSMGHGYHRESERRLRGVAARNGRDVPVVTSAGALVDGLRVLGARRVSIVTPYMKPLTELVKSYIEAEDIEVLDTISLEISNNIQVGSRDPLALTEISKEPEGAGGRRRRHLGLRADALAGGHPAVEERLGLPVVSAAVCTTYHMLKQLGLEAKVPNAGALLSGRF
jgi:maleate isomerase